MLIFYKFLFVESGDRNRPNSPNADPQHKHQSINIPLGITFFMDYTIIMMNSNMLDLVQLWICLGITGCS